MTIKTILAILAILHATPPPFRFGFFIRLYFGIEISEANIVSSNFFLDNPITAELVSLAICLSSSILSLLWLGCEKKCFSAMLCLKWADLFDLLVDKIYSPRCKWISYMIRIYTT